MSESIIQISHSQLGNWSRCRFKHFISYRLGYKPRTKNKNMAMGSYIHAGLAEFYKTVQAKRTYKFDADALMLEFAQSFTIVDDVDMEVVSHGTKLLRRYVNDYVPFEDQGWEPLEVDIPHEVTFETPKGREYTLIFITDRLMKHHPDGRIWLFEDKTTANAAFWNDTQIMMDPQTPTYLAGLRKMGIDVYGIVYQFINRYEYKNFDTEPPDKLFGRKTTYRTPVEVDSMVRELGFAVDEMVEGQNDIRRSLSKDCDQCWFQEPCLLSMKGMDLIEILDATFDKKDSHRENLVVEEVLSDL